MDPENKILIVVNLNMDDDGTDVRHEIRANQTSGIASGKTIMSGASSAPNKDRNSPFMHPFQKWVNGAQCTVGRNTTHMQMYRVLLIELFLTISLQKKKGFRLMQPTSRRFKSKPLLSQNTIPTWRRPYRARSSSLSFVFASRRSFIQHRKVYRV